jgi:drug/metabolite transporter (DMT)-like permease
MKQLDVFILSITVLILAVGQLLFKRLALDLNQLPGPGSFLGNLLAQPLFYLSCALYAGATVVWIYALTRVPLSIAYPFTALSMIVVPAASYFTFGDQVGIRFWLGATLIVAGIILTQIDHLPT